MKFKVFSILTGVITLHAVILTGICFTGGCNSTPVLSPRPFIPAPEGKTDAPDFKDIKGDVPPMTIKDAKPVLTPATEPPPFSITPPKQNITYVVKKNDSFWKVARKHGVSMQGLAAYNNLPLNKPLKVGQKLRIPPGGYVVSKSTKIKSSAPKTKAVVKPLPRPTDGTYTVKSGDSIWKIAKRFKVKRKTLLAANNMNGKETLRVGQKIIIPDGKNTVPAAAAATSTTSTEKSTNVKSILDTVEAPEEVKTIDEPVKKVEKETPKSVKKLIEDVEDIDEPIDDNEGSDRAVQVPKDQKVEEFAKQYKVSVATLKRLNEDFPADGVFKAGSVVIIRSGE